MWFTPGPRDVKTAVLLPLLPGIFSSATPKRTQGVPDPDRSFMHFCVLGFDIAGAGPGLRGGLAGGLAGGWVSSAGLAVGLLGSSQALLSGKGALFSQAAPPSLSRSGWAPSSRLKGSCE